jgi:anti-sigma factor RsiW
MDCRLAQEEILELFDGAASEEARAHLAGCAECAAFAARQAALDRELSEMFQPPELSPNFRAGLRRRIRSESPRLWPEALPDLLHVGGGLAATIVCAAVLPFGAGPVLAAGAMVTGASYVVILAARSWLEA